MTIDRRRRQASRRLEIAAILPHVGWGDQPRREDLVVGAIEPAREGQEVGSVVPHGVRGFILALKVGEKRIDLIATSAGRAGFIDRRLIVWFSTHRQ